MTIIRDDDKEEEEEDGNSDDFQILQPIVGKRVSFWNLYGHLFSCVTDCRKRVVFGIYLYNYCDNK
jgi:hypothetical protein